MKTIKYYIALLTIVFFGFFLRYYNNFFDGYWADEILTLEISNPNLSLGSFFLQWKILDGSPIFYFYFIRIFFDFFGFSPENGRLFSVIFSSSAIFISFFLYKSKYNNKISLVGTLLIALNLFLIWQSKDARIPSSVLFFSLVNVIYFSHILKNRSTINIFILCFLNFLLVSYYPFTATIALSQFLYLIYLEKKINYRYVLFFLLSGLAYLYFNRLYLELSMERGMGNIGPLNIKFFLNYFFSSFFGSAFYALMIILCFCLSVFIFFLGKVKTNRKDLFIFHIFLILVTYIFVIFYSFVKSEIAVPRYFIFLIPSINFIILNLFNSTNYKKNLFIFIALTFINTYHFYEKGSIPKPPIKELLNKMSVKETRYVLYNDPAYQIYFKNSEIINNKFVFVSEKEIQKYKKLWFFCLNHPLSIVGNVKFKNDDPKCNIKIDNYKDIKNIYITDFKIVLFEKLQ